MFIRLMLLALCAMTYCRAQGQYVFNNSFNLSATPGVWTIQQPTSNALRVNIKYLTISSSAALKITIERQCTTPATATAGVVTRKNPEYTSVNAKATVWYNSNAAGCTVMYGPIDIPSGVGITMALPDDYLNQNGTDKGITFRTNSVTATGSFNLHFEEVK